MDLIVTIRILKIGVILTLLSCRSENANVQGVQNTESDSLISIAIKKQFIQDTLTSNTDDMYTLIGDKITLYKENVGILLSLFKNNECLYQDTLFPNTLGYLNLWESKHYKSDLSIVFDNNKYNLFVLNKNMFIIMGYFESGLFVKNPNHGWQNYDLNLYPNYISRYKQTFINQDEEKICFVGENWDLAGNPYKGDSLVVNYKNGMFTIDQYYPKSKLPNVEYYE